MFVSSAIGCTIKNLLAVGGAAFVAGRCFYRPPLLSGLMVRTYFLARNTIIDRFYQGIDNPKRDLMENCVDIIVPYIYYKMSPYSDLIDDLDLDFCWPGMLRMCFMAQRVNKIYEQIFAENNNENDAKQRSSFGMDSMNILTAALSGAISAVLKTNIYEYGRFIKRNYKVRSIIKNAALAATIVLVEKACIRLIDWFRPDGKIERIKRIVKNSIYLLSSGLFDRHKLLRALIAHQLFWSVVNVGQASSLSK